MNDVDTIHQTVDLTNAWLRDIAAGMHAQDPRDAWAALRVVLHALRDQLPDTEGAHLAAQLPMLVRGLWYEGWQPGRMHRAASREDYLHRIRVALDRTRPVDPQLAVHAVMTTLKRHVSAGELRDLHAVLPAELQGILAPA
jgi:uncharacterized protein (DUF2267 family)